MTVIKKKKITILQPYYQAGPLAGVKQWLQVRTRVASDARRVLVGIHGD